VANTLSRALCSPAFFSRIALRCAAVERFGSTNKSSANDHEFVHGSTTEISPYRGMIFS
jgi:hypothetical protein